jgi:putative nucleotidyltransferase with HDIG domain
MESSTRLTRMANVFTIQNDGQALERWGLRDEARRLYEAALHDGTAATAPDAAQLLRLVARTYLNEADLSATAECAEASYAIAELCGDRAAQGHATNILAIVEWKQGNLDEAKRLSLLARENAAATGDAAMLLTIELLAARLCLRQDDHEGARAACARLRALATQLGKAGDAGGDAAEIEYVWGLVERACGDARDAEQHFVRAESIAAERHDLLVEGEASRELAELFREQGRNRKALQRLNRAHRLFEELKAGRELADVDSRTARLENDFLEVARKWGESIESKDKYTQGHCVRVADLACAFWSRVGGDEPSLFWFRIGALLHDVGKLAVPPETLNKPGKLTVEEWALMRGHPTAGVMLLADIEFPWDVRPLVESHHERWDGRGYPHGLAGEEIPLTARVLGIADVYDALTSERSYRRALPREEALEEMRRDAGTQFDPELFAEFEGMMMEGRAAA